MISPYFINHSSKYLCPVYKDIAQISMALRGSNSKVVLECFHENRFGARTYYLS